MGGAPLVMKLAGSLPFHLALATLATACVADSLPVGMLEDPSGTETEGSAATDASGGATSTEPPSTTSDAGTTSSGPDTDASTGTIPDVPDDGLCHVFDPSCPEGQKCMPWSTVGDSSWDAWGCFPVDEDPVGVGETCHLESDPFTGIDDCEEGSMCWDVDPKTFEGTCFPFCIGSARDPVCADPDRFCDFLGDGAPYLCSPLCDPLAQDCPPGQGCYPHADWWACSFDGSGAYGEPCELVNGCEPGLVCQNSPTVPPGQPCEGTPGCCTELCDLGDPLGDAQCAGAAEGQTCQPWYDGGDLPAGFENVGVCALP
jgi:hypothetical protein